MDKNARSDAAIPPRAHAHEVPGRWAGMVFLFKAFLLRWRRRWRDLGKRPRHHAKARLTEGNEGSGKFVRVVERRGELWGRPAAAEFPLTAGKVENLRRAASAFDGLEIPAGAVLSFWRQLGKPLRRRGFVPGRELREGCVIPAVGGGICQLSGLLYQAALEAGLEIVERHAHSRILPGSAAEQGLDATVFWNYVDLRLRGSRPWRLEARLSASELVLRILIAGDGAVQGEGGPVPGADAALESGGGKGASLSAAGGAGEEAGKAREGVTGDCLSCGMRECFRHPAATAAHAPAMGHSAFLLDARWPEFDEWCAGHSRAGDRWLIPMDGRRWRKPNYAWTPGPGVRVSQSLLTALGRSFLQRRLPAQGAARQQTLLAGDRALARAYVRKLDPQCRHLVISQNLLPHVWRSGALGGRTFDVLMERWPLRELQRRLDQALKVHADSATLGDFRADPALLRAEEEALAAAARLISPHRGLCAAAGGRALRLDWRLPVPVSPRASGAGPAGVFFPASRLARKGVHELARAWRILRELDPDSAPPLLLVAGRAAEGGKDPLDGLEWRAAGPEDLAGARLLVLPAWVEHQPRAGLRALASGIPVIATASCGLPEEHPLLHLLPDEPDAARLAAVLRALLRSQDAAAAAESGKRLEDEQVSRIPA